MNQFRILFENHDFFGHFPRQHEEKFSSIIFRCNKNINEFEFEFEFE